MTKEEFLAVTPYYPHKLGAKSLANLKGVKQPLIDIATLAITLCEFDGTVIPGGGLRTREQAAANAANGTGILNSRHLTGDAIDLIALTNGRIDWQNLIAFKAMARAVKIAAATLEIPIRQGCDWNMNGKMGEPGTREYDWPHFEITVAGLMGQARAEMRRFRIEIGLEEVPE
jgi:peptidoglycan L-alanyl-D-glutamate endopeptidase CwlK